VSTLGFPVKDGGEEIVAGMFWVYYLLWYELERLVVEQRLLMTWIIRFGATYCFTVSVFVAGLWMVQVLGPGLRHLSALGCQRRRYLFSISCGYLCCSWLFIILFYLLYRSCIVHL